MTDATELLQDLKDIHEPVAPATSSALLLALMALFGVLVLLGVLGYFLWRRKALNRMLQQELALIGKSHHQRRLHQLAVWLRRVMHHLHGDSINQLQNDQWLDSLNKTFSTNYFSEGRGSVFGLTLYQLNQSKQPGSYPDTQQICSDLHKLVGRVRLRPGK